MLSKVLPCRLLYGNDFSARVYLVTDGVSLVGIGVGTDRDTALRSLLLQVANNLAPLVERSSREPLSRRLPVLVTTLSVVLDITMTLNMATSLNLTLYSLQHDQDLDHLRKLKLTVNITITLHVAITLNASMITTLIISTSLN